jgi:hypothetical protein
MNLTICIFFFTKRIYLLYHSFFFFVFTDCGIGKVEQIVLEGKLSICIIYNTAIPAITKTPLRIFFGFRIIL